MWSVIKAARWYVLLTLVLFSFFLVINFPAHYAWKLAKEHVPGLPVKISSLTGTVWRGTGTIGYQHLSVHANWRLNPWSLFSLSPELEISSQIDRHTKLSGLVKVSSERLQIQELNGSLSVPVINPYLKVQKVSGNGIVSLYNLGLGFDYNNNVFEFAEGRLMWKDAKASYPGPKGIENIELPDIVGKLTSDENGASLDVMSGADGSALASAFVMNKGWAGVKVKKRSVDLVGQTWVGNQQPDDIIFQVREKLW